MAKSNSIRYLHKYTTAGILVAVCALAVALQVGPLSAQIAKRDIAPPSAERKPLNYFISGHSLTDNPLPQFIAGIALGHGLQPRWNQQVLVGSPISWRTWGGKGSWQGYREGKNANDRKGLDLLREFRERRGAEAYQSLIIAEGHNTAAVLRHHDTVRYLRHFHERLIEGNPAGTTFLYEPWESIVDLANPGPWINLERDASKIWGCVVDRVNISLAHEGRPDRIKTLPIGAGLTTLIEEATKAPLAGISGATATDTVKVILIDDVHLTRVGLYYAALLTYMGITGEQAIGAWHPPVVTPEQAKSLQQVAQKFHDARALQPKTTLHDCRRLMANSFCDDWNRYVPSKWVGPVHDCKPYFSRETSAREKFGAQNPRVFDAATDASYWLPAPVTER